MNTFSSVLCEFNPLKPVISVEMFRFTVGGHTIIFNNHMFMIGIATLLLIVFIPLAVRRRKLVPSGSQNIVEFLCVFLREQVAKPALGHHADKYLGFIWTLFFFILTMNLLGMIPTEYIFHLATGKENHYGGPATANIWVTGGLAIIVFFLTHIAGMKQQGIVHYWAHFAPKVHWTLMWFILPPLRTGTP